jgi:patatin-like phospholipase/acyl hydrolase
MRVLAIDGGGIRGYLPALLLRELERRAGERAGDLFDLIVGTSTGGIIGIGLATGRSAEDLADFYPRYGRAIFGGSETVPKWKQRLIGPTGNFWADFQTGTRRLGSIFGGSAEYGGNARHTPDGLNAALKDVLGDSRLSAVRTPLAVTTFDGISGLPVVLSSRDAIASSAYDLPLWEVARATSAAPTYFPAHETNWANATRRFIDGGVWANNPCHIALLEALALGRDNVDTVTLVSLGTGTGPTDVMYEPTLTWLHVAKDTMSISTSVHSGHLLVERSLPNANYYRLQVVDKSVAGSMDDPSSERLSELAAAATRMIDQESNRLDQIVGRLTAAP